DDARVTDRARCARLIEEAANELGVLREKWAQNLYGDTALKVRVLRKVDFPGRPRQSCARRDSFRKVVPPATPWLASSPRTLRSKANRGHLDENTHSTSWC